MGRVIGSFYYPSLHQRGPGHPLFHQASPSAGPIASPERSTDKVKTSGWPCNAHNAMDYC